VCKNATFRLKIFNLHDNDGCPPSPYIPPSPLPSSDPPQHTIRNSIVLHSPSSDPFPYTIKGKFPNSPYRVDIVKKTSWHCQEAKKNKNTFHFPGPPLIRYHRHLSKGYKQRFPGISLLDSFEVRGRGTLCEPRNLIEFGAHDLTIIEVTVSLED